jgi:hypothetical protein
MRLWQHLMNQQAAAPALQSWRYWRTFIQTNDGNANSIGIGEIELRATLGGADLTTGSTPALASTSNGGFVANNVRDNDTGTVWISATGQVTNQWVRLDLATAKTVAQVAIYPRSALLDSAPKDFIIQGSDDGTTFTDVKAFTGVTGWSAAWRTFDL